jgi:hypothetical protein
MIENFSKARNPRVFVQGFIQNFLSQDKNPEYSKGIKEMREKEKAPYKMNIDPKELMKF